MYVEVTLQQYTPENISDKFNFQDLMEKETRLHSSETMPIEDLFRKTGNEAHNKNKAALRSSTLTRQGERNTMLDGVNMNTVPTKVQIQGKPGIGKSTLLNHMSHQWAKGSLWSDVKYLFAIDLKEFNPDDKWSLRDLLLDEFGMSEPMKSACFQDILAHSENIVILIDAIDEFSGFRYSPCRLQLNKDVVMSTLVSAIIGSKVLPGAKVITTTRPSKQSDVKAFDRIVQLPGFTSKSVHKYIRETTNTAEEKDFIMKHIDTNPSMAGLCHVPLQCGFICGCLADAFANNVDVPTLNTTTDLYREATLQTASKVDPRLKDNQKETNLDDLLGTVGESLQKHADLAIHGILSSPQKFFFGEADLEMFGFDETDRKSGFLVESQTQDRRMRGSKRPCWTFVHATMLQFFAAIGVLRSSDNSKWESLKKKNLDEQLKTMVCFLAGLLEDSNHKDYVKHLVPNGAKLQVRDVIAEITGKLNDDATTISAVFETQNADMVDIVGGEIKASNMSPSDVRALAWVLEKERCRITSLRYVI